MKLKFIFLGKENKEISTSLINIYLKRLNHYIKSDVFYFSDTNVTKLEKKILYHIRPNDYLISLDENGKNLSTLEFKKKIKDQLNISNSLIFLVGNAYCIPKSILLKSNFILSLSKMTLPHMLARVLILEQSYRIFAIINKHPYHHE